MYFQAAYPYIYINYIYHYLITKIPTPTPYYVLHPLPNKSCLSSERGFTGLIQIQDMSLLFYPTVNGSLIVPLPPVIASDNRETAGRAA